MTDEIITKLLGLEIGKFTEYKGQHGYMRKLSFNGVGVYDEGREDMGIMVQMAGKACRFYEKYIKDFCWIEFLRKVVLYSANITRIDIAIDEYKGLLDIDKIKKYLAENKVISRFREYNPMGKRNMKNNEKQSDTLYFGSRSSSVMFRLYDKYLERIAKGYKCDFDKWVRFELELKDERAAAFVNELIKNGDVGLMAVQVINNYIRFIELVDGEKNRSRLPTAKWWSKFITTTEKLKLGGNKGQINSIDDICKWLERNIAGSLKLVQLVKGEHYINRLIDSASLSDKQKIIYKDYIAAMEGGV